MTSPVNGAPHFPLTDDRLTSRILLEQLGHFCLNFCVGELPGHTLGSVVVANLVLSQGAVSWRPPRVLLDGVVELSEVIVLHIVLLDGRPVLPPAQLAVSVPVEVVKAPPERVFGDVTVRIVALDHHVVLFHPLFVRQDAVVKYRLFHVALALGMVPESADLPVVLVVFVLFPVLNDAVGVRVTQSELVADIGLKADVIVHNIVQAVEHGQGQLQVFPSIPPIRAILTFRVVTGTTLHVLKDVVPNRLLVEGRQVAFEIDRAIFGAVVLEELLRADLMVVIEVDHLENSHIFCPVGALEP